MDLVIRPAKKTFPIADYRDQFEANAEASRYARQFTSQVSASRATQPLLWVDYDRELKAYVIYPNLNYMPGNLAWKYLQEHEQG